ncbi:MAG: hypothetical protein NC241_09880 [Bacteroides sp.]|nr:hypothetical protein [Bacteroides sp.]MCM1457825.1 hypothetical protein [Lachnoclostridium sp.]
MVPDGSGTAQPAAGARLVHFSVMLRLARTIMDYERTKMNHPLSRKARFYHEPSLRMAFELCEKKIVADTMPTKSPSQKTDSPPDGSFMVPDSSGTVQPTAGARLVRPYNAYILILTLIAANYSLIKN